MMTASAGWAPPVVARPHSILEFRAMASRCRIVTDDERLARHGVDLVHDLERRWSRFLPHSEVNAVNDADGAPCRVSTETITLFERAEIARSKLGGAFNPFVGARLAALGYGPAAVTPTGWCAGPIPSAPIDVLPEVSMVQLAPGLRFDPGGIGKGLAADLVVERLVAAGAETVQIELGGDVRVAGPNWGGRPWSIEVADPLDRSRCIARLGIDAGAAATSSPAGTTWRHNGRDHHHLIDPSTGEPSRTDVLSVTSTSTELWWAEVVAKAAVLAGTLAAPGVLRRHDCAGLVLSRSGHIDIVEAVPVP